MAFLGKSAICLINRSIAAFFRQSLYKSVSGFALKVAFASKKLFPNPPFLDSIAVTTRPDDFPRIVPQNPGQAQRSAGLQRFGAGLQRLRAGV